MASAAVRPLTDEPYDAVIAANDNLCLTAWRTSGDPERANQYYRARYYDPELGRFLSEDPIPGPGDTVGVVNPYLFPYTYVNNDPINLVDPSGLQGVPPTKTPPTKASCELGAYLELEECLSNVPSVLMLTGSCQSRYWLCRQTFGDTACFMYRLCLNQMPKIRSALIKDCYLDYRQRLEICEFTPPPPQGLPVTPTNGQSCVL